MKNIKVPDWWDSIRAILSLILSTAYCYGILISKIPKTDLDGLKELATLTIVFYFVLKKRSEGPSDDDSPGIPPSGVPLQ